MSYFLWIDLETTGLDETQGSILEVAWILTQTADLNPIYQNSSVVYCPHWKELANDYVREMHQKSGLARELSIIGSPSYLEQIEKAILTDLDAIQVTDSRVYLAGSSIHFDRRWIRHHLPELEKRLHYRMLDVTTLKLAFGPWGLPDPQKAHRAMSDLKESLGVLKHYRDYLAFDLIEFT